MATKKECADFWRNKSLIQNIVRGVANSKELTEAEAEYSQKCGMYNEKELKCIGINSELQAQIQLKGASALSPFESSSIQYNSSNVIARLRKEFNDNNCTQIIEQYRQSELGDVVSKFTGLDKARIEAESIYERNQRIFFGGLVLIGGIVIITMFSKKK